MIKPTIGRVVWFWCSSEHSWSGRTEGAQPFAALVTFVHDDNTVNLAVFDKEGDHIPHPCVYLWQGEGERPQGAYCEWMPYQKGQAAKVEAGIDSITLANKVAALEAEMDKVRNFVAMAAKDISDRQAAKIPDAARRTTNAPVPSPPLKTSNSNTTVGENPSKDGTGVA